MSNPDDTGSATGGKLENPDVTAGESAIQIIPPAWYVEQFNLGVMRGTAPGSPVPPYRGTLDPLVMACWHMATQAARQPLAICLLSGV